MAGPRIDLYVHAVVAGRNLCEIGECAARYGDVGSVESGHVFRYAEFCKLDIDAFLYSRSLLETDEERRGAEISVAVSVERRCVGCGQRRFEDSDVVEYALEAIGATTPTDVKRLGVVVGDRLTIGPGFNKGSVLIDCGSSVVAVEHPVRPCVSRKRIVGGCVGAAPIAVQSPTKTKLVCVLRLYESVSVAPDDVTDARGVCPERYGRLVQVVKLTVSVNLDVIVPVQLQALAEFGVHPLRVTVESTVLVRCAGVGGRGAGTFVEVPVAYHVGGANLSVQIRHDQKGGAEGDQVEEDV